MKKLFLLLSLILLTAGMIGAQDKFLIIYPESLEEVNSDNITGLNIDKIGRDYSNRPCSRLKIHVNRMTRSDIEQLEVKTIGGNVVVMKSIVPEEGGGLIVELTANPNVKLYLHHEKYGDSSIATLNLQANKEYRLKTSLNEHFSILVDTNLPDSEIYLDGDYKGSTGTSKSLTVPEVMIGKHLLKAVCQDKIVEQAINVSSHEIRFILEFPDVRKLQNFLVFDITPEDAILQLEDEFIVLESGRGERFINEGRYRYKITAPSYHEEEGIIDFDAEAKKTVSVQLRPAFGSLRLDADELKGGKVYLDDEFKGVAPLTIGKVASGTHRLRIMKEMYKPFLSTVQVNDSEETVADVRLEANFSNVTMMVPADAEILVNGELKGIGEWTGRLEYAMYKVECRMANHRTTTQSIEVVKGGPVEFMLEAPAPIYTSLKITSEPSGARVDIDGVYEGETPLYFPYFLVGKHTITASDLSGSVEETVELSENENADIHLEMPGETEEASQEIAKITDPQPRPRPVRQTSRTRKPYMQWIVRCGYNLDTGLSLDNQWKGSDMGHGYNFSVLFHHHPAGNFFYWGAGLDISTILPGGLVPTLNILPTMGMKLGQGSFKLDPHIAMPLGYDMAGKKFHYGCELGIGLWMGRFNIDFDYVISNPGIYYKPVDTINRCPIKVRPETFQIKVGMYFGKKR